MSAASWTQQLRDAVRLWLTAKRDLVGETRVPGSETVASVHLSVYCASAVVAYASQLAAAPPASFLAVASGAASAGQPLEAQARPADCAFALVGDAAFGVPYFRSLNNGLVCGSELAAALSEHGSASGNAWRCAGEGGSAGGSPPLEAYARFVERLATQEVAAARLRAKALAIASLSASTAHKLPAGSLVFEAARIERWRQWPA